MKRNYLLMIAVLFVCTMSMVFSATHVFDERKNTPVFSKQRQEQKLEHTPLPHLHFPKLSKEFFSQFAP
ncbi:MAG: hypothetical protein E7377_00990 [Clostridiales bacterium]|nr:hypothetical protein [Clostridiales bacterium]